HPTQAPEAGARAELVDRFHVHVTLARPGRRADDLGQERFGGGIAVQDIVLAALLVIYHELHGESGTPRPAWMRRRAALTGPGARAELVARFPVHVTLARPGRRADDLGQERFRGGIAVQDIVLAALLVIYHELHGDSGIARPAWMRRRAAITDHVARIDVGAH